MARVVSCRRLRLNRRGPFDSAPRDGNIRAMRAEAVIFDLDGTLVDSLADIGESMNEVLAEMALPPHPLDSYRTFVGDGITVLACRALPPDRRSEESVAAAAARMGEIYRGRLTKKSRPYDGIERLLDELAARSVRTAVLSNKRHDLTVRLVSVLFGDRRFEAVLGHRDGVAKKPAPASAVEIAGLLGLEPARILYVGDTAVDMQTATAAGMPGAGAAWGFRPEAELTEAGATIILRHPLDVLSYVA
jgi:phosphoglycolate phosphatase